MKPIETKTKKTREITITQSGLLIILNLYYESCRVVGIKNTLKGYKLKIIDLDESQRLEKYENNKIWR